MTERDVMKPGARDRLRAMVTAAPTGPEQRKRIDRADLLARLDRAIEVWERYGFPLQLLQDCREALTEVSHD